MDRTYVRTAMRPSEDGTPKAVLAVDGVWVDGETMTLEVYRRRFKDRARREVAIEGVTLAELVEAWVDGPRFRLEDVLAFKE